MPVPVLEKGPWIFNVNNLFTEASLTAMCQRQLLELKNALVALGGAGTIWTSRASCDASSYLNIDPENPVQDLWVGLSDMVPGSTGARSWCILENSTTGGQLLIEYGGQTGNYYDARIIYSPGGTFSDDGTATSPPTHTDGSYMWHPYYHFAPTGGTYYKVVVNVMCSADHKITRWYNHVKSGTTSGGSIGLIEEVQDAPSEWNSTIKTMVSYNPWHMVTSATGYNQSPRGSDVDDGNSFRARYETAEPYAGWLNCYPTVECYGGMEGAYSTTLSKVNASLGMSGGYPMCPIGLFRDSGAYCGILGRLADIYWAPVNHVALDNYPGDASYQWVKWGCYVVPWNGTEPIDAV